MKWILIIWVMGNNHFTEIGPFKDETECKFAVLAIKTAHEKNVNFVCIETYRLPYEGKE